MERIDVISLAFLVAPDMVSVRYDTVIAIIKQKGITLSKRSIENCFKNAFNMWIRNYPELAKKETKKYELLNSVKSIYKKGEK